MRAMSPTHHALMDTVWMETACSSASVSLAGLALSATYEVYVCILLINEANTFLTLLIDITQTLKLGNFMHVIANHPGMSGIVPDLHCSVSHMEDSMYPECPVHLAI